VLVLHLTCVDRVLHLFTVFVLSRVRVGMKPLVPFRFNSVSLAPDYDVMSYIFM
jgi:hypothetical protein